MKKIILFGFCLTLFTPSLSIAQSIPTGIPTGPQTVFNSGGIIQGGVGFSGYGGGQCGTSITTGLSNTSGNSPTLASDKLLQGGSSNFVAQISVTHQIGNPCLSQKEQLEIQAKTTCWQSKTQFILNNPTMSISQKQENIKLFDDICGKK
jgi:hypothetical protein